MVTHRGTWLVVALLACACLGGLTTPSGATADAGWVPFYRLYNPTSGDHFYTTDASERDQAVSRSGYRYESIAAYVSSVAAAGLVPLYRFFDPGTGDHFYTADTNERDQATNRCCYRSEPIAGYVSPSAAPGLVAFYRLYNPTSGDHFYTTDSGERDQAVSRSGYRYESIAAYVAMTAAGGGIGQQLTPCSDGSYPPASGGPDTDGSPNLIIYNCFPIDTNVFAIDQAGNVTIVDLFIPEYGALGGVLNLANYIAISIKLAGGIRNSVGPDRVLYFSVKDTATGRCFAQEIAYRDGKVFARGDKSPTNYGTTGAGTCIEST